MSWRDWDRATLDRAYSARDTVADIAPFLQRYAALSAEARRMPGVREAVPYGDHPTELLDIFPAGPTGKPGAPVFIYIHGGYWRMLGRQDSAFMASALRQAGIATVAVDYELAPTASMDRMVDQVRRAVAWVYRHGEAFGLDPSRIHLGGSSAGAHLAAMSLADGWHAAAGVPSGLVRGALAASGLYELEPLRHGAANEWLRLDEAMALRNSPRHMIPRHGCPLIVVYAGSDTAEFKRQSREYAARWVAAGHPSQFREMPQHNHFDNILELADPSSRLFRELLAQVEHAR